MSSVQSAKRASEESGAPVMATIEAPMRLTCGRRLFTSSVSPEFDSTSTRSNERSRPRSPCSASVGCRLIEGVPVEASVAEILAPTSPALPRPVTITMPSHASTRRTASRKPSPTRRSRFAIVLASSRITSRACSSHWLGSWSEGVALAMLPGTARGRDAGAPGGF
jgi:hypothetical protein